MKVTLAIEPHQDNDELLFGKLTILHVECNNHKISIHRNPSTDAYQLHCKECGFRIELKNNIDGTNSIFKTSIDEQPRRLKSTEFNSELSIEVELISMEQQA